MGYNKYEIGQRIFTARMHDGMKQSSLCKKAGLSQSTLSDIENGKQNLTVETLYKIADALGLEVFWLLGEDNEKNNDFNQDEMLEIYKFKEYLKNKRIKDK